MKRNRQIVLTARPEGIPRAGPFAPREAPVALGAVIWV
jgi:hypothetical protein